MNLFKKLFQNSRALPQTHRYFVRHIREDFVRYNDGLYFIPEDTLMEMDKTFSGKPVYIHHIDAENDSEERISDKVGDVVKSFYNENDGWHWAEIMVNDDGQSLFNKGWTVSNAHRPERIGGGGVHNNQNYEHIVNSSEYEHLAITDSPRYEGALVLTPDEFKEYNENKSKEIQSLKNSKEIEEMDEETLKKLSSLVAAEVMKGLSLKNSADEKDEGEKDKANEEEEPKEEVKEDECHNEEVDKRKEIDDVGGFLKSKGLSDEDIRIVMGKMEKASYEKSEAGTADNETEDKEEEEKKDNECGKAEEAMKNSIVEKSAFSMLKNAKAKHYESAEPVVDTTALKLARGNDRYGL